jgi:hypothetical protein
VGGGVVGGEKEGKEARGEDGGEAPRAKGSVGRCI